LLPRHQAAVTNSPAVSAPSPLALTIVLSEEATAPRDGQLNVTENTFTRIYKPNNL